MYDKVHLGQTCIECFDIIRSLIPKKKKFYIFYKWSTKVLPELFSYNIDIKYYVHRI